LGRRTPPAQELPELSENLSAPPRWSAAMSNPWDADHELTSPDAARLIEQQFPELAPARLELLGVGWDNVAYQVNDRYVFRFPRRQIAAALIEREIRVLPLLAPHLPLAVPVPSFTGKPQSGYPYPFAGYPLLPGIPATQLDWSEEGRACCAASLGRFLASLHCIPVDDDTRAWAPGDDIERANIRKRAQPLKERLQS
jgi:aminoglycoside phosphotransferase (APT) family kinase protein